MTKCVVSTLTLPRKKNLASTISYFISTHNSSKFFQYFVFHGSNLQYITLLLWAQIHVSWSADHEIISIYTREIANKITLISHVNDIFESWTYSAILVATWTYLIVLSALFAYCSVQAVKKSQNNSSKLKKICQELFALHFGILFCLANVILIAPRSHSNGFKSTILGLKSHNLALINLPFILLNCLIGAFASIVCFNPFSGIFSSRSSFLQSTTFFSKLFITCMLPFLDNDNQAIQIILSIMILVFSLCQLVFLYRTMPFYCYLPMQACVIWTTLGASLCSINILALLFIKNILKQNTTAIPYINLFLIPIVTKFALVKLSHHLHSNFGAKSLARKSESEALKVLLALDLLRNNSNLIRNNRLDIYEVYFQGDLAFHAQTCKKLDCFCSLKLNTKDKKKSLEHYVEQRSIDLIVRFIQDTQENNELRIALANIILQEENQNLCLALINLFGISDITADFFVRVKKETLLKRVQARLDEYFADEDKDVLDMKTFINFHTEKADFIKSLASATKKYMDFWLYYKQPSFRMIEIIEKSKNLESEADSIDALWDSCTNKYPQFHQQMSDVYCSYLEIVRNSPCRANKTSNNPIIEKITQKDNLNEGTLMKQHSLFLPDAIVFNASLSKGKLGRINYVSENIKSLLGYLQSDLIDKNINVLMSPLMGSSHDSLLAEHIHKGRLPNGKISYTINQAYVKAKRGFLVPCSVYLTIFPYIQNDINYIAIVRLNNKDEEFMIVTEDGLVEGFSDGIRQELNLSNTMSTYFSDLCVNRTSSRVSTNFSTTIRKMSKPPKAFFEEIDSPTTEKCERPSKKRYGFFQKQPENDENKEEILRKCMTFTKQRGHLCNNEDPYVNYDTKVEQITIMENKFFIITFQRKEKDNGMPEKEKKNTNIEEILSDVPNEITSGDKEIMSPDIFSNIKNEQKDTKCFMKAIVFSPRVILETDNILLSSNRMRTETCQLNYETEQNLLSENIQMKETVPNNKIAQTEEIRIGEQIYLDNNQQPKMMSLEIQKKKKKKRQFSISSLSKRMISDLEEAVYSIPKENITSYRTLSMFIFSAVCVCLLVFLAIFTKESLGRIEANLSIMRIANERTFRLIEIKRTTEGIYMLKRGLLSNDRYKSFSLPPFESLVKIALKGGRDSLNKMNGLLRVSLNHTELKLHQQFYNNLVPLVRNDSGIEIVYKNTFDGVTDLINRVNIIIGTYPATLNVIEDEDLNYVRRNILNELLLSSEQIGDTLVQDVYAKYDNITDLSFFTMMGTLLSGFGLMNIFLCKQSKLRKDRDKFLDLFLHIDDDQVTHSLDHVKNFEVYLSNFLSRSRMLEYTEDDNLHSEPNKNPRSEPRKGLEIRRKQANMRGINEKQGLLLVLRIVLFLIFAAPFIHYFVLIKSEQITLSRRLERMVEVNTEMYKTMLLTVSLYEYIVTNGTGLLRGRPVGEEWENMFRRSSQLQQIFMDLLITNEHDEKCDPSVMQSLQDIINGDLCEILPPQRLQEVCPDLIHGFVRKGMQAVNSFYFATLRNIKDEFDSSNKTLDDAVKVLGYQDLREIEMILIRWQYASYDTVGNILKACTLEIIQKINDMVKIILGVYILFFIFGSVVITPILWKSMEQERVTWRKIFRAIPIEIVSSSKMLKSYLVKEKGTVTKPN